MSAPAKIPAATAVQTFAEAFLKMQAAIKPAIKDTANGAFKGTKYADLGAVWDAIKGPLHECGFSVIQSPDFDGEVMWLRTTILHVSGERIEGRYPLRPSKPDPQGYGSALTYARRYSISAMLGVIADDDDDGNAASGRSGNGNGHAPAQVTSGTATAMAPSKPEYAPDPDVERGSQNFVDQEKPVISACERLPEMYQWLDENGESWTEPVTGSKLYRLKKSPKHFEEIKAHYMAHMAVLNKKGVK